MFDENSKRAAYQLTSPTFSQTQMKFKFPAIDDKKNGRGLKIDRKFFDEKRKTFHNEMLDSDTESKSKDDDDRKIESKYHVPKSIKLRPETTFNNNRNSRDFENTFEFNKVRKDSSLPQKIFTSTIKINAPSSPRILINKFLEDNKSGNTSLNSQKVQSNPVPKKSFLVRKKNNIVVKTNLSQEEQKLYQEALKMTDRALEYKKNKLILEESLENLVHISQKTRNFGLYGFALKLQGKAYLIYGECHKAVQTFRLAKDFTESNNMMIEKLKNYKYLGRCFQWIGNYKMAIFYLTKMLQNAWLSHNRKYELVAYDLIGLQYYYMGDIEHAKYYHEKMMNGQLESENSELRKLAIDKLKIKLSGAKQRKMQLEAMTIEEELGGVYIPDSEDEFELPSPKAFKKDMSELSEEDKMLKIAKKTTFQRTLQSFSQNFLAKQKKSAVPRFSTERDINKLLLINKPQDAIIRPPSQILISHMSPNRLLNNFHFQDPQAIANNFVKQAKIEEGIVLLDLKSLDWLKKKITKFRILLMNTMNPNNGSRISKSFLYSIPLKHNHDILGGVNL